ncbi:MAG: hypothetical protein ACF8Q5_03475 [Phycisphaerales bacterium JB040]
MRTEDGQHASEESAGSGAQKAQLSLSRGLVLISGAGIASALLWAALPGETPLANIAGLIEAWALAGWAPAAFLIASYGLGTLADRLWHASPPTHAIHPLRLGTGLALMLTLVHALGVLGWLTPAASFALLAIGVGLAVWRFARTHRATTGPIRIGSSLGQSGGGWAWLLVLPLGLGIVASASPPGWLWASEFGGYDALSYHLQLPQEWLRLGRIQPLEHNVYSYLPSYLESATVLLGHVTLAPIDEGGLTAGAGWRALTPQILHWMITVLGAWTIGHVAARLSTLANPDDGPLDHPTTSAWIAGAATLATGWVLVTGTLAYNEMAVVLLGSAAMLAALEDRVGPCVRTTLAAFLVGVACGCKPTAILFVAPLVGVLLVWRLPRKALVPALALGAVVGTLTVSPWLVRNWLASGNPVFPALTGLFGTGHWDDAAAARYAQAHTFDGTLLDRVRMLVWTAPGTDAPGTPTPERFRGFGHPQWWFLAQLGGLACLGLLINRSLRPIGIALSLGLLLQVLAWGGLTHLQSRFLLPCVLTLAPALGVLGARWWRVGDRRRLILVGVLILHTGFTSWLLWTERAPSGGVGARLAVGSTPDIGRPYTPELGKLIPSAFINHELPDDALVYLLGDATPFYYETPVLYNTTYDSWPLGDAIRDHPDDPGAWGDSLRSRGVTHVLIAFGELARLSDSGWIDPDVTPERVRAWSRSLPEPVMIWFTPRGVPQRVLYALPGEPGSPEGTGDGHPLSQPG